MNTLKSKTKTVRYYNDNNVLCWSYALKASFKVKKGTNAIYDSSSASAKIYKTSWNTVSEKHFGSKNTATGSITMKTTKKTVTKFHAGLRLRFHRPADAVSGCLFPFCVSFPG